MATDGGLSAELCDEGTGAEHFDVCFCIGSSWVQHCCVLLVSVLENTAVPSSFRFHVFSGDLAELEQKHLRDTAVRFGAELEFHHVDKASMQDLPIPSWQHLSVETFFRLAIPALLPESVEYALYLDCDMLALADLADLFPLDWCSDSAMAGVVDGVAWASWITDRLGVPPGEYVNSGVLVMNLRELRRLRILETGVEWLRENGEIVLFADQDALNVLLRGRIHHMGDEWNWMWIDGNVLPERAPDDNVCLCHFAGRHKPWHYRSRHPLKSLYFEYLARTPYAGASPSGRTPVWVMVKLWRTAVGFLRKPRLLGWFLRPSSFWREMRLNCGEW